MKRLVSIIMVVMLIGTICLAETIADIIPGTSQWGISRTRFKETNGHGYSDIEIDGLKGLYLPNLVIDGYDMCGYIEFSSRQGNYYGLSKAIYLLVVPSKLSDSKLTKCFNTLLKDMTDIGNPTSSTKTKAIWQYSDCTMEISVGKYTALNGSNNKTVAVVFSPPEATTEADNKRANTMRVKVNATCKGLNHVGNEWSQEFYVNDLQVDNNTSISIAAGDTITVRAKITEIDKHPDSGQNQESYIVTQSDIKNGFSIKLNLKVRESNGRYSGNEATWEIVFSIK